jgi:alpha-N-arabinofuranosidase
MEEGDAAFHLTIDDDPEGTPHAVRAFIPAQSRGALALAAAGITATALVAPTAASAEEPAAIQISVNPAATGHVISPTLFGANHRYAYDGFGMWDTAGHQPYPGFVQQVKDAGISAIRYPGGTIANRFDWKASIGPVSDRLPSPHGGNIGEPITAEFGPDEFGQFLDATEATGSIVVNFATDDAASAADWVEYMSAPVGSNPRGGTAWADVRAANGHPEPYDIAYWEVANEPDLGGQKYWRDGAATVDPAPSAAELYTHGGSTRFTKQWVARDADYRDSAARSDGTAGQQFIVKYAPVAPGSATIFVNGTAWQRVDTLAGAGAASVFTLDEASGRITFGDGIDGRIPPATAVVSASYVSGPHDGFVDFYREMKAANADAQVCLGAAGNEFIDSLGPAGEYDCAVYHSYVTQDRVPGGTPWTDFRTRFLTKPDDLLYYVKRAGDKIAQVRGTAPGEIPIIVTEFGHMGYGNSYPSDAPNYHRSLDEGLYNAEYLRQLIQMGTVDFAMRHALIDYQFADAPAGSTNVGTPDDGMFGGPGPQTIAQPQALVYGLFKPMHGQMTAATTVTGSPDIVAAGGDSAKALTALSSVGADGAVTLMVINRSVDQDLTAQIDPGMPHGSSVTLRSVEGDSPIAFNTPEDPDAVSLRTRVVSTGSDVFAHAFPAHSVTTIQIPALSGTDLFRDGYSEDAATQPPTGYAVTGPAGAVTVTSDDKGGQLLSLARTATGSSLVSAVRPVPAAAGDLEVTVRVRADQTNAAWGLHLLDTAGAPVARVSLTAGGRLAYTQGAVFVDGTPYTADVWHDIALRLHRSTGTYDVVFDGDVVASGRALERSAASVSQVRVQIPTTSTGVSALDVDDLAGVDHTAP